MCTKIVMSSTPFETKREESLLALNQVLNGVNGALILKQIAWPRPQHCLNLLLNFLLKYCMDYKGFKEQASEQCDAGSQWKSSLWFSNLH